MASEPLAGVYPGNWSSDLERYENWLGGETNAVLAYTNDSSWEAMDPSWIMSQFEGRTQVFSFPLFPQTSSLWDVANGRGDGYFREYAEKILANADNVAAPDGRIFVRTGWEMGGDAGISWQDQGNDNPELFKEAFRHFADAFHDVSDRFAIVFDPAFDKGGGPKYYPGDDYVDVISQDLYWFPEWYGDDAKAVFERFLDEPYGPTWMEEFAAERGKQTAYTEWGAPEGYDASEFIELMKGWFEDPSHNVAYHIYWDVDSDYPGRISDGSDSATGAAYRDAFG